MYFEIYQEAAGGLNALSRTTGQWRWRLRSANHEPIASGESYINKVDCMDAINLIKNLTVFTEVKELPAPTNALAAALRGLKG